MKEQANQNRICLIYNYAQHYRLGIFKLLNDEMSVNFYFGDKMEDVKKLDYSELSFFKKELKNIKLAGPIYWQKGSISLLLQPYRHYIILGEYFCISTWILALLGPIFGKKIYFWTHGWYGKEGLLMRIFKKIFFKLADDIFLYGERAKKLMLNEGFQDNHLHVLYNSLNYKEQLLIRDKMVPSLLYYEIFNNDFPTIIFIGRLTKVKKLEYVIEALDILRRKEIYVNFCLIGSGEGRNSLESLADEYNLSKQIRFEGSIYDESIIAKYIYNANVCVSPGNVGLTAMHSMVFGTPVITNNNFAMQMPEYESIIDGVTGSFFIDNDVNDLSLKIEIWIADNIDREKTRSNCFSRIDSYFNPYYQLKIINDVIKKNS